MEINKDKYLKELKKLGLDDLKAKSFLYDLERDLKKDLMVQYKPTQKTNFNFKKLDRRAILYLTMVLIMIVYLIWIFSSSPDQGAEVVKNVTQNVTNVINNTPLVNQTTIVN